MSNFLINLVRRGAGLAPQMPVEPRLTPFFVSVSAGQGPEAASGSDLSPDNEGLQTLSKPQKVSSPPAHPVPSPPIITEAPATPSMAPTAGPSPLPSGDLISPPWPRPPREAVAAEKQTVAPTPLPPEKAPVLEGKAPEALKVSTSVRAVDAPAQTADQVVVRPRLVFRPQVSGENDDQARSKVFRPESLRPTPESPRPSEAVSKEPGQPDESERRQPLIRPAPRQPPEPLLTEKASRPPAAARPIQVRIGTIEVRTTTPPPPAPTARPGPSPQGFEAYRLLRSYTSLD